MRRGLGRKIGGVALLVLGALLLVTPGPGIPLILVGLKLLGLGAA